MQSFVQLYKFYSKFSTNFDSNLKILLQLFKFWSNCTIFSKLCKFCSKLYPKNVPIGESFLQVYRFSYNWYNFPIFRISVQTLIQACNFFFEILQIFVQLCNFLVQVSKFCYKCIIFIQLCKSLIYILCKKYPN